ncbi:nucleoplasmin-like protein ANO39 [Lingula anatina]|uniref:Nucleoplasmin-like protein ANO39 n=1 Tax=Lingula anatina TaxID=7574 RepID=A0A1S3H9D9_LINAN|nr:nucleoplasmin-like protein ANO39 [Lingula anatina]|eukprot:XP_013381744.1 nucleoplasmin-like protein ANO39 [Lingula anatina]
MMAGLLETPDLSYTDHQEYLWCAELSKDKPQAMWNFKEEDEDRDFLSHVLYLKSAVLSTSAETGEDNVIEVETTDYSGSVLKVPIAFLNKGQKNMCHVDHSFDQNTPATFRLIAGTGPVFLTAQHQVEFPQDEEEEDSDEYGEHDTQSEEEVTQEENEDVGGKLSKARKRKATTPATGKEKRGKIDPKAEEKDESMEASTNGTESDEEDEELEEEEESEEEEEEEESPEKSKKSKKKKGAANGKTTSKKAAPAKAKPTSAKKASKGKKVK